MKILALNPPFLPRFSRESRSPAVAKSGTLYYPMWLAYTVGFLEKQTHDVLFIDAPATGLSLADVVNKAKVFEPVLAILDTSTPSIYNDIGVAAKLKETVPGLFTVLVGVHVSALPEESLKQADNSVDAVAFGEYDATLVELAESLNAKNHSLGHIAGLCYKDTNGTILKNPPRPYIEILDDLPFVASVYKKHLDITPYFYSHSRHPIIVTVTGRGCPYTCTYCAIPQTLQGHRYRKRSIENVLAEFAYIAGQLPQVKEIMIEDDALTTDIHRCRELSRALINAGLTKIPWSANSRADVDFDTMRLMKKAGCRLFCVGFESGSQEILDNIQKATTIEKTRRFVKEARRAGILVHGCFMVGNRGETKETLETTLRFAKELNPDTAQFFPIMVYPGTSDWEYFGSKGWITTRHFRDWLTEDGLHSSVVLNPDLTYKYLVDFCTRSRKEFYARPGYILAKGFQMLRHPGESKRILMVGMVILRHLFRTSLKRSEA